MIFPERPTCHDEIPSSFRLSEHVIWRPPFTEQSQHFRTCSWCGSIHPEDLMTALKTGASMHGSDWKYGWPHKFYVDVPNITNPEELVEVGFSIINGDKLPVMGKRPKLHAKWYNEHLNDAGLDIEAFEELTTMLRDHSGILFFFREEEGERKLAYSAPFHGYQR